MRKIRRQRLTRCVERCDGWSGFAQGSGARATTWTYDACLRRTFLAARNAAAYAFHMAQAQAFIDGNKRTGTAAALVFLEGNGVSVPQASDELYAAMIYHCLSRVVDRQFILHEAEKDHFVSFLREYEASCEVGVLTCLLSGVRGGLRGALPGAVRLPWPAVVGPVTLEFTPRVHDHEHARGHDRDRDGTSSSTPY